MSKNSTRQRIETLKDWLTTTQQYKNKKKTKKKNK